MFENLIRQTLVTPNFRRLWYYTFYCHLNHSLNILTTAYLNIRKMIKVISSIDLIYKLSPDNELKPLFLARVQHTQIQNYHYL